MHGLSDGTREGSVHPRQSSDPLGLDSVVTIITSASGSVMCSRHLIFSAQYCRKYNIVYVYLRVTGNDAGRGNSRTPVPQRRNLCGGGAQSGPTSVASVKSSA